MGGEGGGGPAHSHHAISLQLHLIIPGGGREGGGGWKKEGGGVREKGGVSE